MLQVLALCGSLPLGFGLWLDLGLFPEVRLKVRVKVRVGVTLNVLDPGIRVRASAGVDFRVIGSMVSVRVRFRFSFWPWD